MHQVVLTQIDGKQVWLKRYASESPSVLCALQTAVSQLFGFDWLRPSDCSDGKTLADKEKAFIQRLRAHGVLAPQILFEQEAELGLEHLGPTLSGVCKVEKDAQKRFHAIQRGLRAIADVHTKDLCLNQSFARNVCIAEDKVGFIDLEHNPLEVMNLANAQARDIIYFLYSTARFVSGNLTEYSEHLSEVIKEEKSDVQQVLIHAHSVLRWIAPIVSLVDKKFSAFWAVYAPVCESYVVMHAERKNPVITKNHFSDLPMIFKMIGVESFGEVVSGIGVSGSLIYAASIATGMV